MTDELNSRQTKLLNEILFQGLPIGHGKIDRSTFTEITPSFHSILDTVNEDISNG